MKAKKNKRQRVALMIDAQNVPLTFVALDNLLQFVQEIGKLGYCLACTHVEKHIKMYNSRKFTTKLICGSVEQESDRYIKDQIISHQEQYDVLILVSGDKDFISHIKNCQEREKKVIVLGQKNASKRLCRIANEFYFIDKSGSITREIGMLTT